MPLNKPMVVLLAAALAPEEAMAQLEVNCQNSRLLARSYVERFFEGNSKSCPAECPEKLDCSECNDSKTWNKTRHPDNVISTQARTVCLDGCNYHVLLDDDNNKNETNPYVVTREFRVFRKQEQIGSVNHKEVLLTMRHGFFNHEGYLGYSYYYEDSSFVPRDIACWVTLEGEECRCESHWCNKEQTRRANVLDCSMLPGGTIIDLCLPPPDLEIGGVGKMEILFWSPLLTCNERSFAWTGAFAEVEEEDEEKEDESSVAEASSSALGSDHDVLFAAAMAVAVAAVVVCGLA